jgi:3-hydroxybutyryl-CoA dehydratase
VGDTVTASVEVTKVREDKPILTLATRCVNQAGEVVMEGEAVVMWEGG